jgi:RsbRD-like negative regulator of sigma factor
LQAIRSQVDDYLLKPTDVPTLLRAIESKLQERRPRVPEPPVKRVSGLLRENVREITQQWLKEVKSHRELVSLRMSDDERVDHIPPLIEQLALGVDAQRGAGMTEIAHIGEEHGKQRAMQGYSIPLLIVEMRLLQRVISFVLQRNLIRMDLSTVIADMLEVGEGLQEELEFSIRGFQTVAREAA